MSIAADLPERLRAERERRGLSRQQAADALRLDPRIIDALESGEFENLGAPVYAKGHLKKYAALLGIPNADLAEMIGQMDVSVPEQVNPEMAVRIAAGTRFGGRSSKRPVVGVALRIDDRPVEIPPAFVSGNVARFVVGADGAFGALSAGSPRPPP